MAAVRLLQRRFTSLFRQDRPRFPIPKEVRWPSFGTGGVTRGIQVQTGFVDGADEAADDTKSCSEAPKATANPSEMLSSLSTGSSVKYRALSNLKTSAKHNLAMIFTCRVCETRSVRTVCRDSYEKGVVVVRCGGCNNLHLIADRLGWFGEPGSVEDLLAARGEEVRRGSADTLNLTLEDLAGTKSS